MLTKRGNPHSRASAHQERGSCFPGFIPQNKVDALLVLVRKLFHNLIPIFTILGGFLTFGQTFDRRFLLGMGVAIVGVTILEVNDLFSLSIGQQLLGDLAALLSAGFFGVHPLVAEQLRTKFNSVTIMTWSSTTSSLLLLPVTVFAQEQLFPSSLTGWFAVIGLAFVGQMLGIGLWTYCLKKISSGFASLKCFL